MKSLCKKVLLVCVTVWCMSYLCSHSISLRYIIPVNYRIDLSMVIVLLLGRYLKDGRIIWGACVVKELLYFWTIMTGYFDKWSLIICLTTAAMDALLLLLLLRLKDQGELGIRGLLRMAGVYVVVYTLLNLIYFIRVHALAYGVTVDEFISIANYYNWHVKGLWSFTVYCIIPFYAIQIFLYSVYLKWVSTLIDAKEDRT